MDKAQKEFDDFIDRLTKQFADEGRLIEAGWLSLRKAWLPIDTPKQQVNALRIAFMAGAQHLFGSIMNVLEAGDEPSVKDMDRLTKIGKELEDFAHDIRELMKRGMQ